MLVQSTVQKKKNNTSNLSLVWNNSKAVHSGFLHQKEWYCSPLFYFSEESRTGLAAPVCRCDLLLTLQTEKWVLSAWVRARPFWYCIPGGQIQLFCWESSYPTLTLCASLPKISHALFTHLVNTPLKFITHRHIKRVIISSAVPPSG